MEFDNAFAVFSAINDENSKEARKKKKEIEQDALGEVKWKKRKYRRFKNGSGHQL